MTCTTRIVAASLGACCGMAVGAVVGVVIAVLALEQMRRTGR